MIGHAPTPWRVRHGRKSTTMRGRKEVSSKIGMCEIQSKGKILWDRVAMVKNEQDAHFIVTACNHFEEMEDLLATILRKRGIDQGGILYDIKDLLTQIESEVK